MGGRISIHNDTQDTYYCSIGNDEAALNVVNVLKIVVSAVALVAAVAVNPAVGSALGYAIVSSTGATVATTAATTASAIQIAQSIADQVKKSGGVELKPGQSHTWSHLNGMELSGGLWLQGHCRLVRQEGTRITTGSVYMRPIFTGAPGGGPNVHTIKFWLDKHGLENKETYSVVNNRAPARLSSSGAGPSATLPFGSLVVMEAMDARHVMSMWSDGGMLLTTNRQCWEHFELQSVDGGRAVALYSREHRRWVSVDAGSGRVGSARHSKGWEHFDLTRDGDRIALRSKANGKFLAVGDGRLRTSSSVLYWKAHPV